MTLKRQLLIKSLKGFALTIGLLIGLTLSTKAEAKEVAKVESFSFDTKEQIQSTINPNMDYSYGDVSAINEFWGTDNRYYIAYTCEDTVYISILSEQMKLQKTLEIKKDLPITGNVIQDQSGNFYIVYGKDDTADMNDPAAGSAIVMTIVKYDGNGKQLTKLTYKGNETISDYCNIGFGTKEPFEAANCKLIIDGDGVLVCRFGRTMYNGHQSSHALYVDTKTMTKLIYKVPYTSHSLEQKVIATSDGGYLMADRGDAFDRGIIVSKVNKYTLDENISFNSFHFRNGYIYQTTYASIAGLAECTNGYALAGVSEKTLSYDIASNPVFNESRNLFLQVISKNFTSDSSNQAWVQLLNGDTRAAEGKYVSITGGCEAGAVDYGVLWLTNYTGNYYASNARMLPIGNDQLLFMWEKKLYERRQYDQYITSYYMVVTSTGEVIIPETEIQDIRLSDYGEPTFRNGYVYWTTSDGKSMNFIVNRLEVGKTMKGIIHVESISTNETKIVLRADQKKKLNIKVLPENADNKKLIFDLDCDDYISISEDGNITILDKGHTTVYVYPEDRKSLEIQIDIITKDTAPKNLKAAVIETDYLLIDYTVKLTWTKSALNYDYDIYRSTKKDSGYVKIDTVFECEYEDTDVKPGVTYYYKVKSANYFWDDKEGENPMSNIAKVYVLSNMKNVKVTRKNNSTAQISWAKISSATGYEIYQYDSSKKKYVLVKTITSNNVTTYNRTGLVKGTTYYFKVRAYRTIDGVKYYNLYSDQVSIKM